MQKYFNNHESCKFSDLFFDVEIGVTLVKFANLTKLNRPECLIL